MTAVGYRSVFAGVLTEVNKQSETIPVRGHM